MDIEIGASCTIQVEVDASNVASSVGSGTLGVFSTPSMISQMERASNQCLAQFLAQGQASVGTHVDVYHTAASPSGMVVTTTSTIAEVDGLKVKFNVKSQDSNGEIGHGTHTRFIIDAERFMKKAKDKQG